MILILFAAAAAKESEAFLLFCTVCAAFAVEHIQTVGHGIDDGEDILGGSLLAAGQGDDKRTLADTRHTAA